MKHFLGLNFLVLIILAPFNLFSFVALILEAKVKKSHVELVAFLHTPLYIGLTLKYRFLCFIQDEAK